MFHLLNMISGFSEIGIIMFGMKQSGILGGLAGVLFYQLGNIVPVPLRLSRRGTIGSLICSLFLIILGFWYSESGLVAMLFMSAGLQEVRAWYKTGNKEMMKTGVDFSKEHKRFFRVLGFMLGFAFNPVTEIFCVAIILIAAVKGKDTDKGFYFRMPKFNLFNRILIVHEMHYFTYCYALLLTAYQTKWIMGISGAVPASLCFGISWIPYVFSPRVYNRVGEDDNSVDYRHKFIFGHSLLFMLLLTIFIVPDNYMKVILWFFTGIGGTTEFYITKIEKSFNQYEKINHDSAENLGHIIGVICCIAAFLCTRRCNCRSKGNMPLKWHIGGARVGENFSLLDLYNELNVPVGIAGIFVFIAIILMIFATKGAQKHEG